MNRKFLFSILFFLQMIVAGALIGQWLYVTTYRLYLEDRTDNAKIGTAWQHFVVEDGNVAPQIVTRNDARVSFEVNLRQPSTLHFRVTPDGPAGYELYLLRNGTRQPLAHSQLSGPASGVLALPSGLNQIEINNRGAVTWSDLRVITEPSFAVYAVLWAILVLLTWVAKRGLPFPRLALGVSVAFAAVALTVALVEISARAFSAKLPYSIASSRRDLGMFRLDPRWQFSARYRKRFWPNSNTFTQWQYGDLVEMAIIPAESSRPRLNRYRVQTDQEGFRNPSTQDPIVVAALGDSFTDGLILPVEQTWPAQLQKMLGVPVQNYGTAGFGPQQERYVLEDYAIRHHPRVVVVAYFAGNDIFDAETFAKYEQGGSQSAEIPGWQIKKLLHRAETMYLYTSARMALQGIWHQREIKMAGVSSVARPISGLTSAFADSVTPLSAPARAYFDRGMFHLPMHGSDMSFAFMPAYLRTLNYSKSWLESRPGWSLTRSSYRAMKRDAEQHGATFVVMFIPFKSQVYLPLLRQYFSSEELNRDFRFYFRENQTDADVETMARNVRAQNEMMRAFCEQTGTPFLDLTPAIQKEIERGNNLYIPDDAHWNAAGQELAARELAQFLRSRNLDLRLQ